MKAVRILAPFGLSTVLFILSYLSSTRANSGSYPVMLMGIGMVLAVVGTIAIFFRE